MEHENKKEYRADQPKLLFEMIKEHVVEEAAEQDDPLYRFIMTKVESPEFAKSIFEKIEQDINFLITGRLLKFCDAHPALPLSPPTQGPITVCCKE